MRYLIQIISVVVTTFCFYSSCCGMEFKEDLDEDENDKWPTICVTILVRDKAHSLPYMLTTLENQLYPKNRIYLWFYVDNTVDVSFGIINEWTKYVENDYKKIYLNYDKTRPEDIPPAGKWTKTRFRHISKLRQNALNFARAIKADYVFMLDADVVLIRKFSLEDLVIKKLPIVAPMLTSDGFYSNFWGDMTEMFYYKLSPDYEKIVNYKVSGCFTVPLVHTAVLIDLRTSHSDKLTYDAAILHEKQNYNGPVDDIIVFASSAAKNKIPIQICNDHVYGFFPIPPETTEAGMQGTEDEQMLNLRMVALGLNVEFPVASELNKFLPAMPRDSFGLDKIFIINLERRPERRRRMVISCYELGIEAVIVDAVDGKDLDINNLTELGIHLMPKYEDPYHKRPMKTGEIGCFLSHYKIWKEIARTNLQASLILEDDIAFTPFFRRRFEDLLADLKSVDWDFVYIGRKILLDSEEEEVSPRVVKPLYSYWTLGYMISETGARKLIRAEPLSKMLPVDEFLPIMFDQHPNTTWKSYFPRRDLAAYSVSPLLVFPTHYTGEDGYISDTEDSTPITSSPQSHQENGEPLIQHYEL